MQTYVVHWQFPNQEAHIKGCDAFAAYLESGAERDKYEGFEIVTRVVNPEGANGWEIVKASDHKAVWKSCHPWCAGFGVDIEVIPVLTDSEFLEVHTEIKS